MSRERHLCVRVKRGGSALVCLCDIHRIVEMVWISGYQSNISEATVTKIKQYFRMALVKFYCFAHCSCSQYTPPWQAYNHAIFVMPIKNSNLLFILYVIWSHFTPHIQCHRQKPNRATEKRKKAAANPRWPYRSHRYHHNRFVITIK